jgi:hypothetical protein
VPKITETLQQNEWWYGADSCPYRITEMPTSHIRNVVEWLSRRADQLRRQHYWEEFLEYNDLDDLDVGPHSQAAFHEWLRHQNQLDGDSAAWLERTPLVRKLRWILRKRGTVDGVVVGVHYEMELEDDSDGTNGRAVAANPRLRDRPALG